MGKKTPKAPDPRETSAAQTSTNISTAIANAFLGNVNQVTPDGSLTFDQTDTFTFTDPFTGKTFDIPRFTATQALSPEGQALKGINDQTQTNLATLARDQSSRISDLLGSPFQIGNEATEARLFELGSARLNPQFARDEETLRTRLSNQGIKAGSDPFDRALNRFDERKNDAFNQLLLRGRGQAVQEGLTERNQPINEITALLSGSQVSQPNFLSAAQVQQGVIPTTDVAGIIQADFQNRVSNAGVGNAAKSQVLGGLFSLGAAGIVASDRRVKKDIHKVGKTKDGQPLYTYHYKGESSDAPIRLGLMAQDVEKRHPEAVVTLAGGIKAVDYKKALGAA